MDESRSMLMLGLYFIVGGLIGLRYRSRRLPGYEEQMQDRLAQCTRTDTIGKFKRAYYRYRLDYTRMNLSQAAVGATLTGTGLVCYGLIRLIW